MGDADAKNNLRQTLTSLRKVLDPYLDITREQRVHALPTLPWSARRGRVCPRRALGSQPTRRRSASLPLTAATAHYRGDLLEGVLLRDAPDFEDSLAAQRLPAGAS